MRRALMILSSIIILMTTATIYACDWGDANGDGSINVGDAVHIINYIFKGGPPPNCPNEVPALTTSDVTEITQNTAQCGGTITSDGGATVTARGVCWSTNPTPTVTDNYTIDGTGTGSFVSSIPGLTATTTYFVRAYATNSAGTGYGNSEPFTTGTLIDIDGNVYQTVIIGTQVWMAENLKVTHYRNGDAIPTITDNAIWVILNSGACCNYNNNVSIYGRLYNWYAVNDGRNIAPVGWHVASDAEWQALIDYLGGSAVAGSAMKVTGWFGNTYATNESGFSALAGGFRWHDTGDSFGLTYEADFWSSTEDGSGSAWSRTLGWSNSEVYRISYEKRYGYSIRCVKD